jgi:FAD binding domain/Berberine and berberine like
MSISQYGATLDGFRGELFAPRDEGYDDARAVHNGMIDKHPSLVARCTDVADVQAALAYARDNNLDVAVRGGGHSGPGNGVVDGGVVIDLGGMRGVRPMPTEGRAQVDGGATLGAVDHALHPFGMAVPAGIISTTGVGGLVLGGGVGHLTRSCGLSIDNMLACDVVLADGRLVRASEDEHPDLFWALRGGGGNFGVVTSFEFRTHPVRNVVAGPMLFDIERAEEIMQAYRELLPQADRRLGGFFAFLIVPPVDPFPAELQMKNLCGVVCCWNGAPTELEPVLAPFRALGPVLDGVAPMPLPAWNSAFDGLYPKGTQQYWRGDYVSDLSDAAIARYAEHGSRLPTLQSTMHLYPIDGAAHDVAPDATPWGARTARYAEVILGAGPDPAQAGELRQWVVDYHEDVHPYAATGGSYINFMMDEGTDRVRATYGANYDRLAQVKEAYDPGNVFHVNQNIAPAHAAA